MERKLRDSKVKNAKTKSDGQPNILTDGGGLYLYVTPKGKHWRFSYRYDNKRQTLSIGSYPEISLEQARELHRQARAQLARGIKPNNHRHTSSKVNTFQAITAEWLNRGKSGWSDGYVERMESWFRRDVFPAIGAMDISEVNPSDIIRILQKIEARGAGDSARRVKQSINQVFRYAVTLGLSNRNPATDIDTRIILKPLVSKHFAAITEPLKVGQLLRDMANYQGSFVVRCALQLSALVMLRPGELRAAEWEEIDLEAAIWTIEVRRMKAPTHIKQANQSKHVIPLSMQAVAILQELQPLTGRFKYVFPSARGASRCMSENAVRAALRTMGYDNDTMTAHGFRGMASSLLNELGFNPDAIERQLAHKETNKIRAAYNRAQYMEERTRMMQAWADYLDQLRTGGQVIPFKTKVK
ncbi:MAG: integrase arm-type DNA-binding domain-containing protein [Candidatus Thiothrix putei]|uniref:Integrase arm-type DNA-binding domain-containing protein n=1 Tax=Candidatus Thiothrix putei TaxID=3080811 RepID=A0AA95KH14_9GAMM|nr:integrase arm-type DNA-binding domain-containing protein [Thiothrix caldifontis]WGZ92954.1 MAG: integrase arm-type DNA-binding domain-containing protein [Candidatus Thiothrix putei]